MIFKLKYPSAVKLAGCLLLILGLSSCQKETKQAPAALTPYQSLLNRVVPEYTDAFIIDSLPGAGDQAFEIASQDDKISLRGNNGVAIASALYYYIKEYAHGQITWNGTNLNFPKSLPLPDKPVRKESPYEYRYYLNYCTFNYSMSWWDWERWEKEIDWMALNGINLPLQSRLGAAMGRFWETYFQE